MEPRPSLRTVAAAAGLTPAAVSMALRNHPRVSRATAARVQAIARELGYRRNPLLGSVLTHVRRRGPGPGERLALIWFRPGPRSAYERRFRAAATARAGELGWGMEEFAVGPRGLSPRRLTEVLRARGLRGLVFAPLPEGRNVTLDLDWSRFSVVATGNGPWDPEFHRCAHHQFLGVRTALQELGRRGFLRPGLVFSPEVHERALRMPLGAFVTHHPEPAAAMELAFPLPSTKAAVAFRAWLRRHRPDAVLFLGGETLLDEVPPRPARRLVMLDRNPVAHRALSGIEHDVDSIGCTAVDIVVGQLLRNETGVPPTPQAVLCAGRWRDADPPLPRAVPRPR